MMEKIMVPTSTYHVFGSGSGHVRLVVDGQHIKDGADLGHNGFLGWRGVDAAELRSAKNVEFEESYYPGGSSKFIGSGRHFVKWFVSKEKCTNKLGQSSPRPKWLRNDELKSRHVKKILSSIGTPNIAGGGSVPLHFYTKDGRWDDFSSRHGGRNEKPTVNQDGLSSWGTVVAEIDGVWYEAPVELSRRIAAMRA